MHFVILNRLVKAVKGGGGKTCPLKPISLRLLISILGLSFASLLGIFNNHWRTELEKNKHQVIRLSNITYRATPKLVTTHINTKQALTEYLADYTLNALKDTKSIAITFSKQTKTNIQRFNLDLAYHDHEEADTLSVLHTIGMYRNA